MNTCFQEDPLINLIYTGYHNEILLIKNVNRMCIAIQYSSNLSTTMKRNPSPFSIEVINLLGYKYLRISWVESMLDIPVYHIRLVPYLKISLKINFHIT